MPTTMLIQLAVAIGLGLLVGLQRERTDRSIGGIRTFPLIALLGFLCALLGEAYGGWVVAAGFLALAASLAVANFARMRAGGLDSGMTTEVSALLLFALGGYLVVGNPAVAAVVGGVSVLLLHFKQPMHRFAGALGETDMRAIMQFVVLTMVILPVLPREDYGPYGVWNPFNIWLMVALIVAISLSGYAAYKLFGATAGPLLAGLLGGLISSTATTVSYARRTAASPASAALPAFVIVVASSVAIARTLVEVAVAAPTMFAALAPPIAALLAASIAIAGVMFVRSRDEAVAMPEQRNPASLGSALLFGAIYAIVLLAVEVARRRFGDAGLFAVAALSGLTDTDAITLSTAKLAEAQRTGVGMAWRAILIALMANLVFKLGIAAFLGGRALALRVGAAFAVLLALGGAILWLWPF